MCLRNPRANWRNQYTWVVYASDSLRNSVFLALITSVKTFSGSKTVSDFTEWIISVGIYLAYKIQVGQYFSNHTKTVGCLSLVRISTARPPSGPLEK